ncbi:hypothetical protein ACTXLJ_11380 [Psychrobacter celer]|uniref:hypothetical protein n=1 Tax=Psychrobacter celer TaxID=306572 RepID=UPI003FD40482
MNSIHLKPTQKFITFSKYNLVVHQDAQKALLIWHQFRPRIASINMASLDDYYRPPLRLVSKPNGAYYFFNEFRRIDRILTEEVSLRQPCLITAESLQDIKRLAWCEVLSLSRFNGVDHPMLFKAIYQNSPKQLICELMGVNRLTVASYCQFAGISQSAYEYQQCKVANDEAMLGLPKNLNWMDTSYGSH